MIKTSRRQFLSTAVATGLATSLAARAHSKPGSNDAIGLGYISCGNRAVRLMEQFDQVPGVNVTALCDVDASRLGTAKQRYPKANGYQDLRELLADKSVDAVVISTCNHWHCLAAIWAMQAGKDVYVEKPLSHTQWEGRQVVAAARKYDRICQVGTQQRSDPMQAEIKKFLHEDNDAGQTPNVHFAYFDTGSIPVVIGLTNLPAEPGSEQRPEHLGPPSGYIAHCEGGRLEGQRKRAVAKDADGKVIRTQSALAGNGRKLTCRNPTRSSAMRCWTWSVGMQKGCYRSTVKFNRRQP